MEKLPQEKKNQFSQQSLLSNSSNLWDCGSTLYDSFELNSLKRQLNSAIISNSTTRRTLSMSHLPERRLLPLQQPLAPSVVTKKHFNISRSFQKLLRFVFKSTNNKSTAVSSSNSNNNNGISFQVPEKYSKERVYVVYDKSGPVLSAIPEVPEFEINGAILPEISSFVRRSASERFTTTALGISCTKEK